jgi:TPR repeat protein
MGLKQLRANHNFNLGVCYDVGKYTQPDYEQAVKYYTKAVELGHVEAQIIWVYVI